MSHYKLSLGFHATFALKKEDLLKVLKVAEIEGLQHSTSDLSRKTGLGVKKVTPMMTWLTRSGLICDKQLTPEGFEVIKNDPYLESPVTDWLMHFNLSFGNLPRIHLFLNSMPQSVCELGGWSYFIFNFLPKNLRFSLDELVEESSHIFTKHPKKDIRKNFKMLLRAYTEPYALKSCHVVSKIEENIYAKPDKVISNGYITAYILAKLWQRDFLHDEMVDSNHLLDKRFGFLELLGNSVNLFWDNMEKLEELNIVQFKFHAKTKNNQIRRCWSHPTVLLKNAYQS
jgi:hypothetical protein